MVRKGVIGIPQDGRMTACSYTVKHYEEGSVFGIDGGRISKLAIKIDGKTPAATTGDGTASRRMTRQKRRWRS